MAVRKIEETEETVEGHFTIEKPDGSVLGYLYYTLLYSKGYSEGNLREHEAILSTPCLRDERYNEEHVNHYFENGAYVYSELHGSSFLDRVQLPEGMVLCRRPSQEEYDEMMRALKKGEGREIKERIDKKEDRFKPLSVTITDFNIPLEIRTLLQEADEPIIKTVIGNYI